MPAAHVADPWMVLPGVELMLLQRSSHGVELTPPCGYHGVEGSPPPTRAGRCTLKGMKTAPRFTWIKVGGNWAIRGQGPLDKGDVVSVFNRTRGSETLVKIKSVIGGAEGQVIAFIEKPRWSGGHPRP